MARSHIAIIGAPMDLGAGRRGVDMGPSALRLASLNERLASLGYKVEDLGNIHVVQAESVRPGASTARYLNEIAATCTTLAGIVEGALAKGDFPVVLGGDHSVAIGTIAGIANHYRKQEKKLGLVWIDAHADMNTPETSPSGNIHGMPLACSIGIGPRELTHIFDWAPKIDPRNVAVIGLRSVDSEERKIVQRTGVHAYTMRDIDERGLRAVVQEALEVATEGTAGFHLSFDMDSVDPHEAPGVGTPVKGGMTYRESHLAMENVCDCDAMLGLEVVEVNPVIDEANRTALLAVELVMSALGKRIL
ncbi:MAG: arginase [Acidobacteria bacterium]|nr:arginase [Acidobacteriota bacterium]